MLELMRFSRIQLDDSIHPASQPWVLALLGSHQLMISVSKDSDCLCSLTKSKGMDPTGQHRGVHSVKS
jgi:hypothetical protein